MSEVATREPQLRFPEFSDSLIKGALGDYALIKRGAGSQYIEYSKDSKDSIRLIRIGDFLGGDAVFVRLTNAIQRFLLDEGDILIAGTGATAGITFLVPTKFVGMAYSYNAPKIKVHKDNVSFFYQYLISPKIKIQQIRLFTGNAQPFLDTNAIKGFSIFKPPLQEQQKIAAFLTAVDNKIEQLSKKQALLGEYKKCLMQKIFSQAIRFKADDGSEFPDWEEKKLGGVGRIRKGSQLNKSELTDTGDYPAINGGINPSGYTDKWNTGKNTITISEGGNSCGYINFITSKFWSGGHCYSIEELKGDVLNRFLFQYLKFNEHLIMRLRVGSGLPNIQKGEINNFKVNLPSLEEQTKIANLLSSIDSKIEQVGKQLRESKQFKKALLQQMFV